jgi:hypothetical protein
LIFNNEKIRVEAGLVLYEHRQLPLSTFISGIDYRKIIVSLDNTEGIIK